MDLYEYKQLKKNNLFPFSVIEFCEVVMFNRLGHNMCDRKLGFIPKTDFNAEIFVFGFSFLPFDWEIRKRI